MKTLKIFAVAIFIMGSSLFTRAQTMTDKGRAVDYEALAQKLVNQCAKIHEGEIVIITGGVREFELLENIAVNVRKMGAFPLITIGSDRITRRMYTDVPIKYDSQIPELSLKLLSFVTAIISVDYSETTGLLADIPPERFITIGKASAPVNELVANRNVKGVTLGNGLYPTEAQAIQFGLTQKELSDIFWNGINVDYPKLEATGIAVKKILSGAKEVQITNINGTDIKMRIENRQVLVSDGSLSDEDLQKGYAASQVYLPAGEVYLAPIKGTSEGKIVVDRVFYQDKEINGLALTFQKGKLTSMTAKSGIEPFKAIYDAAEPGKEEFAFIDLGINPDVYIKPNSKLVAWMPAGMITVGIGNNIWAGGENKNPFAYSFFLPGSTIKVDGKVLVENGILKN
jgi:leucyl aminopeptidase (aminopeptidase T)